MAEFDCKKCLHEKVCALWASRESQDASCFCTDGCDYFTPTLTPPNEPLTLEELREMDGEPVYLIVDDQYEPLKMWALIEVVETANCVILTSNLGGRNEYYDNDEMKDDGVTAYRRPPEGEARKGTMKSGQTAREQMCRHAEPAGTKTK